MRNGTNHKAPSILLWRHRETEKILLCAFANENRTDTQGTRIASERERGTERERERKREIFKIGKGKRHVQNEKRSKRKKNAENFLIKLGVEDCTKYIK